MKKYILKRILFGLFSLVLVVGVVMVLVYSAIDRSVIFQGDATWSKRSLNDRAVYEYNQYQKYGYLTWVDYTTFLKNKYEPLYGNEYTSNKEYMTAKAAIQKPESYLDSPDVQEFIAAMAAQGKTVEYLEPVKYANGKTKPGGNAVLLAYENTPILMRMWKYFTGLVSFENTSMVKDPNLTDRYIRVEKDPYGFYAVVGSGTQHKYLIYFDNKFPFIHQNWMHLNLGMSYTTYRGQEITQVITEPNGDITPIRQQYPTMLGTDEYVDSAIDFHSVSYNNGSLVESEKAIFTDNYSVYSYHKNGFSMIGNSFVIGIIATMIAYMLGLPLGILMARKKDKLADRLGNLYIIFIMAVPSLAYIFMFSAIGTTVFGLPNKFATAEVKVLAYVLPVVSLALPSVGSLMKWMRRYMIDQMNSDYVKFARAEGLSEREIFSIHISRNALIPLVHGIPSSILGSLTGAIITERVYGVPGVGRLLTTAINSHDNNVIVMATLFYTFLSIVSVILGDLLLAKYDPRISLSSEKGGGR